MAVDSQIRIWQSINEYLTFSYAQVSVHYPRGGEAITDVNGVEHTVSPSAARYPSRLTIAVLAEELTVLNNDGASERLDALAWLEKMYRLQAELIVYALGQTLAVGGTQLNRLLAYKGKLSRLPAEYFGTLPVVGSGPGYAELELAVSEDGTFTDFSTLAGYSAYTPARPTG
jgi:hypothetical protein